jgi:uncharacterized membrane protein
MGKSIGKGAKKLPLLLSAFALLSIAGSGYAKDDSARNGHSYKRIVEGDCWEIHSLGTLGGTYSYARDLNNSGQVVGDAETEPRIFDNAEPAIPQMRPFISAPNGGPLSEITGTGKFWGDARAVNDAGQVVGTTTSGSSHPTSYATEPGSLGAHYTLDFAVVNDINNVGQSVFDRDQFNFRSVLGSYLGTDLIEITFADWPADQGGPQFNAVALNDYAQVAVNDGTLSYRWSVSEGLLKLTPDDAASSRVEDINNAGQIIGTLVRDGVEQAFVTRRYSTALVMLGEPGDGNVPAGINSFGQIVGTKNTNGAKHSYVTVLWNVQRTINLDALKEVTRDAWSRLEPVAINNRGQIAGTGSINGEDRAFLLTPLSLQAYLPTRDGQPAKCYRLN